MNNKQLKYYRMLVAIQATLNSNKAIWSSNLKFSDAKNRLNTSIASIQALSDDVLENTKGQTSEKNQIRKTLESKLLPLSGALNAHATLTQDEALKTLVVTNKSSLKKMKETHLVTYSNNLVEKATQMQSILIAEYDLPASYIEDITTQTTAFNHRIGTAKPKRAAINAAKQTLTQHIHQANTLLRQVIDSLMLRYQTTHPQFYTEYQQSRTIVD